MYAGQTENIRYIRSFIMREASYQDMERFNQLLLVMDSQTLFYF